MLSTSSTKLTNLQLELLKLFGRNVSDQELMDIKKMIAKYFADKAIQSADAVAQQKGYTSETFESWLNEPDQ